jgi:hypothetical protein
MRRLKRRRLAIGCGGLLAFMILVVAGLVTLSAVGGDHTLRSVTYAQVPPHSGDHSPVWQRCGFYSEPVGSEHAVHSMEHGAVWITYLPDLPEDQVNVLHELARAQNHVVVSPFPGLPAPVVVSAWGWQEALDDVDGPQLDELVQAHRNSDDAPEPGGSCDGPNMWFTGSTGDPES